MTDKTDHKAIRDVLEAGPVQYACHIDGEVQTSCTFDPGQNLHDCTLATRLSEKGLCKSDCPVMRHELVARWTAGWEAAKSISNDEDPSAATGDGGAA